MCFTGWAAFSCCRPPISRAPQKRAIRSRSRVRVYDAALRFGLGCALSSSTFRAKSKAEFFSARRRNIGARTASHLIFERQHHLTDYLVAKFFFSLSRIAQFPKVFSPPRSRPCDILWTFLRTSTNPYPLLTVVPRAGGGCRGRCRYSSGIRLAPCALQPTVGVGLAIVLTQ